jgi:hypothetical protein
MAPYSKDLRAYLGVKKSMGRQVTADFFTTKVKKVAQDSLFGVRGDEKWLNTLIDFGEAADEDIIGLAKDRLAYAHLFPGEVTTAEMPTWTQGFAGLAHDVASMVVSPVSGAANIARKVGPEALGAVKNKIFGKAFEKAANPEMAGGNLATKIIKGEAAIKKAVPAAFNKVGAVTSAVIGNKPLQKAAIAGEAIGVAGKPEQKAAALDEFNKTYSPVLKSAIQRGGGHSLAVTNFLLQQKDSKYRKLLNDIYDND